RPLGFSRHLPRVRESGSAKPFPPAHGCVVGLRARGPPPIALVPRAPALENSRWLKSPVQSCASCFPPHLNDAAQRRPRTRKNSSWFLPCGPSPLGPGENRSAAGGRFPCIDFP